MKFPVNVENENLKGTVLRTPTHIWIHANGQTRSIEIKNKRSGKQQQQEADPTRLRAPMPGKIIKVMCGAGDKVTPGQTLIVMEAMKMEYTLKSSIYGVVSTRPCTAGQQVALGDLLVQLKEDNV
jgi:acetyl/propionyl-CoA carboxylase alpha subunit